MFSVHYQWTYYVFVVQKHIMRFREQKKIADCLYRFCRLHIYLQSCNLENGMLQNKIWKYSGIKGRF